MRNMLEVQGFLFDFIILRKQCNSFISLRNDKLGFELCLCLGYIAVLGNMIYTTNKLEMDEHLGNNFFVCFRLCMVTTVKHLLD